MKKTKELSNFSKSVKEIAAGLDVTPAELTRTQYFASDLKSKTSEWELRKLGGFDAVKKLVFDIKEEEDLAFTSASKMVKAHRNALKEKYGKRLFAMEEMSTMLSDILQKNPIKMHPATKSTKASKSSNKARTIVAHLSDTHYGANILKNEVGINEFNWTIAARRTALFMDQIVKYKSQYRKDTDLVLCINGDIIAGVIHDQEWFADLLATQYAGTVSILSQAVGYAAQHFKSVKVICTAGNHGRAMHKSNKGRAATHKWDGYETMIFLGFKGLVEAKHKNVKVEVPTTPYAIFEVQGHLFFQTHGDTVFEVGNVGSSLNMKSINTQISKLNASELGGTEGKFKAVLVGHVHTPTVQLTESGCMLVINGCLSGTDPFAQSIGIFESNPTQQLVEVTKEHAVGDIRLIQLKDADKNEALDKIIEPFKGSI
jgi:predicted phosphodiesterase